MANDLTQEQKDAINSTIKQMVYEGSSDEDINAYKEQALSEAKSSPAQDQIDAPAQEDTGSASVPGSLDSTQGFTKDPSEDDKPVGEPGDISAWENFSSNVSNTFENMMGFDDRVALAAVDTFENLLGESGAAVLYDLLPTYDNETGEYLRTPDAVRAKAYENLAKSRKAQEVNHTKGIVESFKEGDIPNLIAASAGAATNVVGTLVTSGLTGGAGIYTDMVADAIYDANNAKAESEGKTVQELYDEGGSEFVAPAFAGTVGGLLERIGIKGIGKSINSVSKKGLRTALTYANASGKEGLTEWLQGGVENYNELRAGRKGDAAGEAFRGMFTEQGLEGFLQGVAGGAGATAGGRRLRKTARQLTSKDQKQAQAEKAAKIADLVNAASETQNPDVEKVLNKKVKEERTKLREEFREAEAKARLLEKEDVEIVDNNSNEINKLVKENLQIESDANIDDATKTSIVEANNSQIEHYQSEIDGINKKLEGIDPQAKKEEEGKEPDPVEVRTNEILEEDLADNEKGIDGISDIAAENNIFEIEDGKKADEKTIDSRSPLTKSKGGFTNGDFNKKFEGTVPTPVDGQQAKYALQKEAKAKGLEATVNMTPNEDGTLKFEAEFFKPREGSLSEQVNAEVEAQQEQEAIKEEKALKKQEAKEKEKEVNPQGQVVGEKVAVKEEGPVKARKARSETEQKAAPTDFVTPERYKGVEQISPDTFKLSHPNQIHKLKNDVAGRNYEVVENEDGTVTLAKGKPSFNLEDKATSEVDRIKSLPIESEDGATFNQDGTKYDGGGVVLPIASENIKASELTPERIEAFKKKYAKHMGSGSKVGIYKFPGQDQVSIDLNVIVPKGQRKRALEIGKKLGQESLFDLDTFENLKTGETGANPKTIGPSAAKRIADEFKGPEFSLEEEKFKIEDQDDRDLGEVGKSLKKGYKPPSTFAGGVKGQITKTQPKVKESDLAGFGAKKREGGVIQDGQKALGSGVFEEFIDSEIGKNVEQGIGIDHKSAKQAFDKFLNTVRGNERVSDADIQNWQNIKDVKEDPTATIPLGETEYGKSQKEKRKLINQYLPYSSYISYQAQREAQGQPINQEGKTKESLINARKKTDEDVRALANEAVSEAINNGEISIPSKDREGNDTFRKVPFNPENGKEAAGLLAWNIRDKVRQFYVGEGAAKGIVGKTSKDQTRINKIKSATKHLEQTATIEESLTPEDIANSLNEGFDVVRQGRRVTIQDKAITPEKVFEIQEREAAIHVESSPSDIIGTFREPASTSFKGLDITETLDQIREKGETNLSKLGGLNQEQIDNISDKISDIKNDGIEKGLSDTKITNNITKEVANSLSFLDISKNYKRIARGITDDLDSARKIAQKFKDIIDGDSKNRSRDLKDVVGQFVGAEIEGIGLGKTIPSPEFSLEERNPNYSGFEFDAGRLPSNRVEGAVKGFLDNSKRNLRGDKFSSILTHRSPEKKIAVKRAAKGVGANVVDHPLNPGEVLILPSGKTLNDVLRFHTSKQGKAIDVDPRDYTSFNENARPDARQYTNLNVNDLINNINSRSKYLDNRNNWGKLNKITQLKPNDITNIKNALTGQGFNVENSVDAKGDPTIVFSKGRVNPNWSLKDVHAPAKENATPEYTESVSKALSKAFPDVDIISTQEGFNDYVNELRRAGLTLPNGIKGLQHGNKIAINPSKATKDTAIHEFGHIWAQQLMRTNPKLWKRGVELLKGSEYMRVIADNPHYKAYLKESPSKFYEEVMANALGKRGAEIFARNNEKAGTWDRFTSKVGDWLKEKLDISSKKDYQDLTLDDWLNVGASSILTGNQSATTPAQSIEYSLENPKNVSTIEKNWEKELAEKAADKAPKGSWFSRATNWLVGPASDDYHGLAQRFERKNPNDGAVEKFNNLTKKYVDGYESYEKNATKIRDSFKDSGEALAKKLGIKPKKVDAYLAEDSGLSFKGIELTNNETIGLYQAGLMEIPPQLKEFADSLGFRINPGHGVQQALLDHINKEMLKSSLSDFLDYKKRNFDSKTMSDIGSKMGKPFRDALDNSLSRMSGNTGIGADAATTKWNNWIQGSVGTIMFLNFRSAALQGLSTWNYMSPDNLVGFNKDIAATLIPGSEQQKRFKEMWNDPMLKERRARAGFDVNANEMVQAMSEGEFSKFTEKLLNKGFVLTSIMDSFAIAAGGAAYVNQQQKLGDSKEQALKKWRDKTQESQQSARPDRVSQQQKSSVSKLILAFANTPAQYFRLSQKASRVIRDKGLFSKEGMKSARQIAYYMAIQNAIFTMAQSASTALFTGWGGDDDEQKEAENALNSMIDTGLRGMGLVGAVIAAAKNTTRNALSESKKKRPDYGKSILKGAVSVAPPLSRKVNDILAIGNAYTYDSDKTGARGAHAVAAGKAGSVAFNIPSDWLQKKLAAAQAHFIDQEADLSEMLRMLGGYSEYSVLGGKEDDKGPFSKGKSPFNKKGNPFESKKSPF